jgi:hypothetical protein
MNKTSFQQLIICAVSVIAVTCTAGQTGDAPSSDNMALELRNMILTSKVDAANATDKNLSAVIMDIHVGDGVASVMSSSGGDASIYLSTGGATIGGGGHENVRTAAIAFTAEAVKHKAAMSPAGTFPYPAAGKVRFYLRAPEGVFFAEAPESDLAAGTHELSGLYRAGQGVITQFRSLDGSH